MKYKRRGRGGAVPSLGCIEPNAAGIDIGATEIYVAVPPDRDPNPVVASQPLRQTCKRWRPGCSLAAFGP